MYNKPELVEFGSLRDLTQVGIGADGDAGIWGLLDAKGRGCWYNCPGSNRS
ncbi:MAG: lasso RiPP family leader peptide-containing protein [Gemmatimonadetes bacterium]|nr:lasso RiPP family leader peptide-containing protein [Gemmatimonadota bacterium]